jgi:uncharacterized damage-inducible protein DinB
VDTPSIQSPSFLCSTPVPVLGCLLICTQCETIARTLTDEQYTERISGKASIGQHLRHCVEHFNQFFAGLDSGRIDYDARQRNCTIEQSRTFFIAAMHDLVQQLRTLDDSTMHRRLLVRMLFAPNTDPVDVASTLARELGFLSSHATHHLAIIKMLAHSLGTSLPDEVGVGNATMSYRKSCAEAPPRA